MNEFLVSEEGSKLIELVQTIEKIYEYVTAHKQFFEEFGETNSYTFNQLNEDVEVIEKNIADILAVVKDLYESEKGLIDGAVDLDKMLAGSVNG